jgi:hypothetical protein
MFYPHSMLQRCTFVLAFFPLLAESIALLTGGLWPTIQISGATVVGWKISQAPLYLTDQVGALQSWLLFPHPQE